MLQDLVDQHMRDSRERPVMQMVMGGKFAVQIICRNVPFRSEKEEDFYQVFCFLCLVLCILFLNRQH